MKGLDLSKFKKIKQDQKSATLRHPDGHEIKVAVGGLSPEMRKKLTSLPVYKDGGGEIENAPEPSFDQPAPSTAPFPQEGNMPDTASAPPEGAPSMSADNATAPAPVQDQSQAAPPMAQNNAAAPQGSEKNSEPTVPPPITGQDGKKEDQNFQMDLDVGNITPLTYRDLAGKDFLGRMGTLFGLIIGGAGAGLSHQPNALLEMMNKEIANNLEAQKASASNKQNLYKLNLEHQLNNAQITKMQKEGNLTDAQATALTQEAKMKATIFTQMQLGRISLHDLVQKTNAAPIGSPERTAMEQQLAVIYPKLNEQNSNLADQMAAASALGRAAFGQGTNGDENTFQQQQAILRISGQGQLADDKAARHIPGVSGQASIPITPADRDAIRDGMQFQNQLQRFQDWTKNHSGDLNPSEINEGTALAANLQGFYRKVTDGGVYKAGEQDFIGKIIKSDPTEFFNSIRVMPQLKAVQTDSAAQLDQYLKSLGFQGYQGTQQASSGKASSTQEGTKGTYMGKPVTFKSGKWEYAS